MSFPLRLHFLLLTSTRHWYPLLPPSVSPCVLLFFFWLALNQQALFSSSRHCYTLSLSRDPFDVVRHNGILLHLGQFSVWRLILHEPISRASQHTGARTQAAHTPIHHPTSTTIPLSRKMKQDEYVGSHTHTKRTSVFWCFSMQARKEAKGIMVIILQEQNNLLRRGKRTIWMCR